MAVSTSSYFSNSIVGQPQVGADIDIYESSTSPKYAVGFGFTRADGNKYRYSHFGALTPAGYLCGVDISESNLTGAISVGLSCGALVANLVKPSGETINPNAVGSRYMQLVITATADQLAGGYAVTDLGTGAGYIYRIKGNNATSDNVPVTGNVYVELYDPIKVAIHSQSTLIFIGSQYANLETASYSAYGVSGAAVVGNSAASYGWICTGGLAHVLQGTYTGSQGSLAFLSTVTAGACQTINFSNTNFCTPFIGNYVQPATATGYSVINLMLE